MGSESSWVAWRARIRADRRIARGHSNAQREVTQDESEAVEEGCAVMEGLAKDTDSPWHKTQLHGELNA